MSDQHHNSSGKNLSEISHLFLSSVREKQAAEYGDMPRPRRVPPARRDAQHSHSIDAAIDPSSIVDRPAMSAAPRASSGAIPRDASIDLTAEEFAQVMGGLPLDEDEPMRGHDHRRTPSVSAIIASHLNGSQHNRVREYAAHLCKAGERVGLVQLDAAEFRLSCFEPGSMDGASSEGVTTDQLDGRQMAELLEEMNWDVDRWLIHLPGTRSAEARSLLGLIDRWVVLATCDHDGVVSCYRTLKGLSDLHDEADPLAPPTLSLALLDAHDEYGAIRVFRKLANVCQQFLRWPLESEAPVIAAGSVNEMSVLTSRATRDKAQLAAAPQWDVVRRFLSSKMETNLSNAQRPAPNAETTTMPIQTEVPPMNMNSIPTPMVSPMNEDSISDIIDLPAGISTPSAIVSAALRGNSEMVECAVKPPMLADASLAVSRDRRLVLLAVASQGLSDLRHVGEAWRWLNENRALISMAVPQCSIDPHAMPSLRLLVDRNDLSAATLQPLMQASNVTVQTYRKLRWGAKTGLLLEAA